MIYQVLKVEALGILSRFRLCNIRRNSLLPVEIILNTKNESENPRGTSNRADCSETMQVLWGIGSAEDLRPSDTSTVSSHDH